MSSASLAESMLDHVNAEASLVALVLDKNGRILKANRYAEQLMGKELLKGIFTDFIIDFTDSVKLPDLLADMGGTHLLNVKTAQGLPQTFYFRFRPVGRDILAIGEINSLELEALRASMITANNELSNLGRELQKRNAELVKLNELKSQLLGMAAHDLRNPIGIIFSYSTFLLDEAGDRLNTEHVGFLSAIRGSSEFMLRLLDDLLDITRIESGKLNLEKEPTDIIAFVRHSVALNQPLARKKGMAIRFNHDETIPEVYLDRHKMEQVLSNLISNALKFSPPGTTVTVSVFRSGDHATVSVQDEGPGIPEEERNKLFKPFSKTSVRATGGEKSTGLGLFIVRKIVLGHQGKIWVESEVGKGSNFCFSLPFPSSSVEEGGMPS